MNIPIYELAYFAGFFDGEGSCGIYSVGKRTSEFRVSLCNNDPKPCLRAQELFGGSVRPRKKWYKNTISINYEWYIYGKKAEWFLRLILPYSIVKTEQINKFLQARTLLVGSGNKRTAESVAALKEAEAVLKSLKRC